METLLKRSFNPWLLVMLIIIGIFVFNRFSQGAQSRDIAYSTFLDLVEEGVVESVIIEEEKAIQGKLNQPKQSVLLANGKETTIEKFKTVYVKNDDLVTILRENNVGVQGRNPSPWLSIIFSLLPIVILIAFFWFIFMRAQGGPSQVMQFGQSRAKTYGRENKVETNFDDVAGHEEAKEELKEVVDFLKHPKKYHQIGAEIPKGALLVGPPGTGKTLLARAIAGEAGVPFLIVSASEFMEMFVGVGASRVRSLFEEARKASPAIIFIDELDSIGRRRGAGIGGGHDEREQTLNQILGEMDGFEKDTSVIVIAATNRPDILDPALLRPGRFDRQVTVGLPTQLEREEILKVHTRKKSVSKDVDLERLAASTPMFSGADLKNLTNEAALIAARGNKKIISWIDFSEALDRIVLGLRQGGLVPSDSERSLMAYHEAGHAVAFTAQPDLGDLRKVTIMPRGGAGGFVAPLNKEQIAHSRDYLVQQLVFAFGGRVAEKKLTGKISTGARADLKQATDTAKQMVLDYGMGDDNFVAWGSDSGPVFLGGEISRRKDFSEETARRLEQQVEAILKDAYQVTETVIEENWVAVEGIAEALLQRETIDGKIIHTAFEKSKEGSSAEDITEFILDEVKDSERFLKESLRKAEKEAKAKEEEARRAEAERPAKQKPLEPRPAD